MKSLSISDEIINRFKISFQEKFVWNNKLQISRKISHWWFNPNYKHGLVKFEKKNCKYLKFGSTWPQEYINDYVVAVDSYIYTYTSSTIVSRSSISIPHISQDSWKFLKKWFVWLIYRLLFHWAGSRAGNKIVPFFFQVGNKKKIERLRTIEKYYIVINIKKKKKEIGSAYLRCNFFVEATKM